MKLFLLASLLLAPFSSHAAAIKPDSSGGKRIVQRLAGRASDAFVAQSEPSREEGPSCESVRDDLLQDLALLELSGSEDLLSAKSALERGVCEKNLFAVTVYLRAANSLN